jgi:hypothetical protein
MHLVDRTGTEDPVGGARMMVRREKAQRGGYCRRTAKGEANGESRRQQAKTMVCKEEAQVINGNSRRTKIA